MMASKVSLNHLIGDLEVDFGVTEIVIRPNNVTGIQIFTRNIFIVEGFTYDKRRQPLAKAHDEIKHTGCSLLHQIDSMYHVLQLVDQGFHIGEKTTLALYSNQKPDCIEMTLFQLFECCLVAIIATQCLFA